MKKEMRKKGLIINALMGCAMSFTLSLVGTCLSGHFTLPTWLLSFAISLIISLIIGFCLPIKNIGDWFCGLFKTSPQSFKGTLLSAIPSDIIYTPIITVVMEAFMLNMAAKHAPVGAVPPLIRVLPKSLAVCLVVGYVAIIIFQPLFVKFVIKKPK